MLFGAQKETKEKNIYRTKILIINTYHELLIHIYIINNTYLHIFKTNLQIYDTYYIF
jgi:hypothetical protein